MTNTAFPRLGAPDVQHLPLARTNSEDKNLGQKPSTGVDRSAPVPAPDLTSDFVLVEGPKEEWSTNHQRDSRYDSALLRHDSVRTSITAQDPKLLERHIYLPATHQPPPDHRPPTAPSYRPPDVPEPRQLPNNDFERRKEQAWETQEDLQDTREELLGLRFALKTRRRELANLRQKTGTAEGRVFNQIRQFMQTIGDALPEHITQEFESLGNLRDRLGYSEVQYDQDEEKYNQLELRYSQKEADFVDAITTKSPESYTLHSAAIRQDQTSDLTRFASGPGNGERSLPEATQTQAQDSTLCPDVADLDIENTGRTVPPDSHKAFLESRPTAPSLPDLTTASWSNPKPVPSVYSDSALFNISWLDARKRIDLWFWDTLWSSKFQQALMRQYVPQDDLDDSEWWSRVKAHWGTKIDEYQDSEDNSSSTVDGLPASRQPIDRAGTVQRPRSVDLAIDDATRRPPHAEEPLTGSTVSSVFSESKSRNSSVTETEFAQRPPTGPERSNSAPQVNPVAASDVTQFQGRQTPGHESPVRNDNAFRPPDHLGSSGPNPGLPVSPGSRPPSPPSLGVDARVESDRPHSRSLSPQIRPLSHSYTSSST